MTLRDNWHLRTSGTLWKLVDLFFIFSGKNIKTCAYDETSSAWSTSPSQTPWMKASCGSENTSTDGDWLHSESKALEERRWSLKECWRISYPNIFPYILLKFIANAPLYSSSSLKVHLILKSQLYLLERVQIFNNNDGFWKICHSGNKVTH